MLFSALCGRIIGGCKNANATNVKNKLNIVEFFGKIPELYSFFLTEIINFTQTDKY
jgi:hypothetical protein